MTTCLCGSGKPMKDCHGSMTANEIRKSIKQQGFPESFHFLESVGGQRTKFRAICRIVFAHTPAGQIAYPQMLIANHRALRPLSIDGVNVADTLHSVPCMVTPIHHATVIFDTKRMVRDPYTDGVFTVVCDVNTTGNPFESVFAMEATAMKIALYHHTNVDAKQKILASRTLLGSKWNFQGTHVLSNVHYIYLTDITQIEDHRDLHEIGMCDKGTKLGIVSDTDEVRYLDVYRDSPSNRPAFIKVWVDWTMLSPNHLILHGPSAHIRSNTFGPYSWWEVFAPSIYRIAVKPGTGLRLKYRKSSDSFEICAGPNSIRTSGFFAALGTDMYSLRRNWSEQGAPRGGQYPADYGRIDPRWVEVWQHNLSSIVDDVIERTILSPILGVEPSKDA